MFGSLRPCCNGCESSAKHNREDGKNPGGSHGLERLLFGSKKVAILTDSTKECKGRVDPEYDSESGDEPLTTTGNAI